MGHEKLNRSLEWMFDFTKLHKVNENLDPNNPVIPVVVQDANTLEVLIVAYANKKAVIHSFESGNATFWSTSRNELWEKGKTSGNTLKLKEVRVNCDQNSLVYLVEPAKGGACHVSDTNGDAIRTCYYRRVIYKKDEDNGSFKLETLEDVDL